MPYAQLDDRYHDTKKVRRVMKIEPAAIAIHVMAITYCNQHNTDGEIESDRIDGWISLMPYKPAQKLRVLTALIEQRLLEWREPGESYVVHDYLDWNRSAAKRLELAEQGRRGGLAKAKANGKPGPKPGPKPTPSPGSSPGHSESHSQGSSTPRHATPRQENIISSDAEGADAKATDDDRRLCRLLAELARERNPKFKVRSPSRWLTDMRLLRQRDGNGPEEIERGMRWVFLDDFWGGVIQSPGNLRQHFPAIWDRMGHGQVVSINHKENATDWLREDFIDGVPITDADVVGEEAS